MKKELFLIGFFSLSAIVAFSQGDSTLKTVKGDTTKLGNIIIVSKKKVRRQFFWK